MRHHQSPPKTEKKQCHFCLNNMTVIDYKDSDMLRKFVNSQSKIQPRRRTGTCALCQRKLTRAVKHARHLALIPFTLR